MPATKRPKPLYQRGTFKLYRRSDRPNLEIVWYDEERQRERGASAGTSDREAGKAELDRLYLSANGHRFCQACGRALDGEASPLLLRAIADYLLLSEDKAGIKATRGRLAHVIDYIAATDASVTCGQIDRRWVDRFRAWLSAKPYMKGGKARPRSLSHIEGCVLQLAAAINATPGQSAQFAAEQMKAVSNSPKYRADVATIAAMFRFCLHPTDAFIRSEKERAAFIGYRANLLRYLRVAVATWARPEEIFDLGQGQWMPEAMVLNLNPPGRRQTRKHRGVIPIPRQFAPYLDDMQGKWMPVDSVRASWDKMRVALKLPKDGEAGEKLIRRSMATIARKRIGEANWPQGEIMLGHVKHSISDIYAIRDPANLGLALAATEAIIDEICALVPASYRNVTASAATLELVEGGKNG